MHYHVYNWPVNLKVNYPLAKDHWALNLTDAKQ